MSKYDILTKELNLRDPLYSHINIKYKIIKDLINSKEFQRLRRVSQLSGVKYVYHTAEHTRFSHSLGVYHLANLAIIKIKDLNKVLSEREQLILLTSALLHDIGHGPFSHSFERLQNFNHEEKTVQIITSNSDINEILLTIDNKFPQDVASIFTKEGKYPIIEKLISSQVDLDRMDYLLRDSYNTGVKYGEIDLIRLLNSMRIKDNRIIFKSSSIHSIEHFIMCRYNMYWQMYYNQKSRAFDIMIMSYFKRLEYLYTNDKLPNLFLTVYELLTKHNDNNEFNKLDDNILYTLFNFSDYSNDNILEDLGNRIRNRKFFEGVLEVDVDEDKIKNTLQSNGYDLSYYFYCDEVSKSAYTNYSKESLYNDIYIENHTNLYPITEYSPIIKGLINTSKKHDKRFFFPLEALHE